MNSQNESISHSTERLSVFEISHHLFAIDILQSREVIPIPKFTPLPNSNETYLGVFNLRGEIFPLIDISSILGFPEKQINSEDMVILIEENSMVLGILVDRIHKVISYSPGEVKLPRGYASKTIENFLSGIIEQNDRLIYILDLKTLFNTEQILAHI